MRFCDRLIWDIQYYFGYVRQAWNDKYNKILGNVIGKDRLIKPIMKKKEAGKRLLDGDIVNKIISEKIKNDDSFMAARFGDNEMRVIRSCIHTHFHPKQDSRMTQIRSLAKGGGLFPETIEMGEEFTKISLDAAKYLDLLGVWNLWGESYVIKNYARQAQVCSLGLLEPYADYFKGKQGYMWSAALKGKKVLVIHPFADTIQKQYKNNREIIWKPFFEADEILPKFELYTIKAVQTIAGNRDSRFSNWSEALQWMVDECKKVEFDVAIIGCGSYGFPLAAEIKKMGKVAIHLGGATQLLFGIRGKRWDSYEAYEPLYREGWVRPSAEETPQNIEKVENSTYW